MTAPPSADEVAVTRLAWRAYRERAVNAARRVLAGYQRGEIRQIGWRWYVPWVRLVIAVSRYRTHLIGETK